MQAEKVLGIWERNGSIPEAQLQPALVLVRTKRAQHEAAWGTSPPRQAADGSGGHANGGATAAPSGPGVFRVELEGAAWPPMNAALVLQYLSIKVPAGPCLGGRERAEGAGCV